jgi:hypothetical protein
VQKIYSVRNRDESDIPWAAVPNEFPNIVAADSRFFVWHQISSDDGRRQRVGSRVVPPHRAQLAGTGATARIGEPGIRKLSVWRDKGTGSRSHVISAFVVLVVPQSMGGGCSVRGWCG